jgi:thymidylate synthase
MKRVYKTADEAFRYLYDGINDHGIDYAGTKTLFNIGFYIEEPWNNKITTRFRKWNEKYAEAEWQWYLTGDPKICELGAIYGKVPEIWKRMADESGRVNSNYGYQWERGYQLDKVVAKLKEDPNTRQAVISIYDGKEIQNYRHDTPCTTAIQFSIVNNRLEMCVTMRSNDLWFGFCIDQYCFSQLHKLVSERTGYEQGGYFHFAHNIHIYESQLDKNNLIQRKADYYE